MAGDGEGGEATEAEVQYAKAKTAVWWDIGNCHVPKSCDPYSIALNVKSALEVAGYRGAVDISAIGDMTKINLVVQQALLSTGVSLHDVSSGNKGASDLSIIARMFMWGIDNRPPANILLISGNSGFSCALHQLRMTGYNILLAHPIHVSRVLVAAATDVWLWTSLVIGGPPLDGPNLHNKSRTTAEKPSRSMMDGPANCTEKDGRVGSRNKGAANLEGSFE